MAHELPDDWQRTMSRMIAGLEPLDDQWFAGGPVLTPRQQIEVYRQQYGFRLGDALKEEVPGLCMLLGDQADAVLMDFLKSHPSRSWTLNRIAVGLDEWLQARGAPEAQVDMARLDRAVQRGFEAAEGELLQPQDLLTVPALQLQPHVSLLTLSTTVHELRAQGLGGVEVPPLETRPVHLVVFRRGLGMRHWELEPAAFALLRGIERHGSLGQALGEVLDSGIIAAEDLEARIQGWFADFASRNLLGRREA